MKRQLIGAMFAVALAAWACKGDPTSSLRNGPSRIDLSANVMFIDSGATKTFVVVVRDEQGNPLGANVTTSSSNTGVFTVVPDTSAPTVNNAVHQYVVTGLVSADSAILRVTSGSLHDSAFIHTN